LNSAEAKKLHPIEYATNAHLRFVTIHPFRDGNGRTARLLMNLLLLRAGYSIVIISNQVRNDYINAIMRGQSKEKDISLLLSLIIDASKSSLVEILRILATAENNRGKGQEFYQEMLDFFRNYPNI
jgi:Fic family protein